MRADNVSIKKKDQDSWEVNDLKIAGAFLFITNCAHGTLGVNDGLQLGAAVAAMGAAISIGGETLFEERSFLRKGLPLFTIVIAALKVVDFDDRLSLKNIIFMSILPLCFALGRGAASMIQNESKDANDLWLNTLNQVSVLVFFKKYIIFSIACHELQIGNSQLSRKYHQLLIDEYDYPPSLIELAKLELSLNRIELAWPLIEKAAYLNSLEAQCILYGLIFTLYPKDPIKQHSRKQWGKRMEVSNGIDLTELSASLGKLFLKKIKISNSINQGHKRKAR